ncbi:MAG: hypothetical protein ACKVQB_04180 [Bacteroidia bacterium]
MKTSNNLEIFQGLSKYQDKQEILAAIIIQLEKDTGLDYTQIPVDAENRIFLETLRKDLALYLKKIGEQSQTRFMHLIYRVDISQTKMNQLEMNVHYYHQLAEMVLNRMFQKVITKRIIKT